MSNILYCVRLLEINITLRNLGDKKLFFRFDPAETANNIRFNLVVEPSEGKLKKAAAIEIVFKIRVFCTAGIYQFGKLLFFTQNPKGENVLFLNVFVEMNRKGTVKEKNTRGSVVGIPRSGSDSLLTTTTPFCFIGFSIESDQSSSLDYDDIQMGEMISKGTHGVLYQSTELLDHSDYRKFC